MSMFPQSRLCFMSITIISVICDLGRKKKRDYIYIIYKICADFGTLCKRNTQKYEEQSVADDNLTY